MSYGKRYFNANVEKLEDKKERESVLYNMNLGLAYLSYQLEEDMKAIKLALKIKT